MAEFPKSGAEKFWEFCGHFSLATWLVGLVVTVLLYVLSLPIVLVAFVGGISLTITSLGIAAKVRADYESPFLSLGDLRTETVKPAVVKPKTSQMDSLFDRKVAEVRAEWSQLNGDQRKLVERLLVVDQLDCTQLDEYQRGKLTWVNSLTDYLLEKSTLLEQVQTGIGGWRIRTQRRCAMVC